jgi:hypothetical protein
MGFWDIVRGRSSTRGPNLDNLFAVPGAAVSLQTALGASPTGVGSVCYRAATGAAMADTQADATALIESDGVGTVERTVDGFGFTWTIVRGDAADLSALVTDLHALNTDLETQGFAGSLLCSVVGFRSVDGVLFGLVYLYKQGTFYPFAQQGGAQQRDVLLERQVRDAISSDLTIEADSNRWLPLWDCPGLA